MILIGSTFLMRLAIENALNCKALFIEIKRALRDPKNTFHNSAGSPSVPGLLFEAIVFKLSETSASVNRPSLSFFVSKINFPLPYQCPNLQESDI